LESGAFNSFDAQRIRIGIPGMALGAYCINAAFFSSVFPVDSNIIL